MSTMDSWLESILINTYNPNPQLRKDAEKSLQSFLATGGSLTTLLNTLGNRAIHRDLRQAIALIIKNRLRDYLNKSSNSTSGLPLIDGERNLLKQAIVVLLLDEEENSIRKILAESVRIVAETEFPQEWPDLIPNLISNIQGSSVLRLYNALLAIRKVVKRYEYKDRDKRDVLYNIIRVAFPPVQQLLSNIVNINNVEAALVMKVSLKIFWSCTQYMLPPDMSILNINFWFEFINAIMNKRLPDASENVEPLGQPVDPEERKQWCWWKLKKWAIRIVTHYIQRYGNPRYSPAESKEFSEYFRSTISIQFLQCAMTNLTWKAQGLYLSDIVHQQCLSYLATCSEMSPTYKVMKPHLNFLLFDAVFPVLCIQPDEIELFQNDPAEYVRQIQDPTGDWTSPFVAATTLLQMLSRYRQKDVLPIFLPFIQNILQTYLSTPLESRDYIKKDGAMVAIATLVPIMKDSDTYRPHLFPYLMSNVLPEFTSPVPFIRSRALWSIEHFSDLDWSSNDSNNNDTTASKKKLRGKVVKKEKANVNVMINPEELLGQLLRGLIAGLRDPSVPVQAAAACSLRTIIQAEGAVDVLRPFLRDIVGEYFRIMEEVESESILSSLQTLVQSFGEEIASFAVPMTIQLVKCFKEYIQETDDEDAAFNAVHCLDTIDAVLEAVQEQPEVFNQLEPILVPLFMEVLTSNGDAFEYIDTIIHMISGFTYYSETLSSHSWSLCGPVIHTMNTWAIDYIQQMMPPILNYMTKGIDLFLRGEYEGKPFVMSMLEAVSKALLTEEGRYGRDIKCASTLLTCLISTYKITYQTNNTQNTLTGQELHTILPQIFGIVYQTYLTTKHKSTKIYLLEVILASLYYDAHFTLTTFAAIDARSDGQVQCMQQFFTGIFSYLKDMERDLSHRLIVLAFSSILAIPPEQLPEIIRNNFQPLFQQIIREMVMIQEEAENRAKQLAAEGDADDDDEDGMYDEDDEDDFDMKQFVKQGNSKGKGKKGSATDDDDEDFDDKDANQAAFNRAKALYVPEGGYDEDEDCINAEDEEYRQVLEQMDKDERVKKELYRAGELVKTTVNGKEIVHNHDDDIDDDENDGNDFEDDEDYSFTSTIETMDILPFFMSAIQAVVARGDSGNQMLQVLQSSLDTEDQQKLQQFLAQAQQGK